MATRKINRRRTPMSKKSKKSKKTQRGGANESLAQGAEFLSRHTNQHGGALLTGSPVGYTGMLPDELRMAARVGGLDESLRATAGMSDTDMPFQKGGRRSTRKVTRKAKSAKSKSKKSKAKKSKAKKSKKSKAKKSKAAKSKKSKKSRRQSGGARYEGAELSASPMLLTPSQAARAGTADFSRPFA